MPDPRVVLGLDPDATVEEARAARRRLAKQLHPDVHAGRSPAERVELSRRMTEVNLALAELESAAPPGPPPAAAGTAPAPAPDPGDPHPPAEPAGADGFTVEALPAEAFEALFLVGYGLGDITAADEPYLLELYLAEPACFCRLSLVPVAGGSLVTVEVAPADDGEAPAVEAIRDLLVAELVQLAS